MNGQKIFVCIPKLNAAQQFRSVSICVLFMCTSAFAVCEHKASRFYVGFYDLMSEKQFPGFRLLRFLSLRHIKLISRKSREGSSTAEANCNLKYSPMSNLSPFPPYHCQIFSLRNVLHRIASSFSCASLSWRKPENEQNYLSPVAGCDGKCFPPYPARLYFIVIYNL